MRVFPILLALAFGVATTPLVAQEGGWLTGSPEPAPEEPVLREEPAPLTRPPSPLARGETAPTQRCRGMDPVALKEKPLPRGTDQLTGVTPTRIKRVEEAHAAHQQALRALEEGSLVEVVGAIRRAYQAGLTRSEADRVLGVALLKAERPGDGLLHMRRALEDAAERRTANFRALGQLHVLSGDTARAIRAFEKAVELDPDDDETHLLLAVTYDTVGHSTKVLEHAQRAIRIDPENKAKLKPFVRNSNVSKRIGCIVSNVLKDSKHQRLTDEAIEGYAKQIGEILGPPEGRPGASRRAGPFAPGR